MSSPEQTSSRFMRVIVIASALLMAIGLLAFWYASEHVKKAPPKAADSTITVTIKNKVCEPNDITVPAGITTFTIVNQSERALEWEILDGVMVVEERENIAPGFSQTMTVKLQPGQFDMTCGLLSNPRGTLRVTPSASSAAEAAKPSLIHYVGALAEYKVYLVMNSSALQDAAQELTSAIKADKLPQAQTALAFAREIYARIEPMAARFADLDTRLNAPAKYFEKREADPSFAGFHRLAYGLNAQHSISELTQVAEQLQNDITTLKDRLRTLDIQPEQLANSAARVLRRDADELSTVKTVDPAEQSVVQGTLDGTQKIADLLAPLLGKAAPSLQQSITQHFAALSTVNGKQDQAWAESIRELADEMDKINKALSLE